MFRVIQLSLFFLTYARLLLSRRLVLQSLLLESLLRLSLDIRIQLVRRPLQRRSCRTARRSAGHCTLHRTRRGTWHRTLHRTRDRTSRTSGNTRLCTWRGINLSTDAPAPPIRFLIRFNNLFLNIGSQEIEAR